MSRWPSYTPPRRSTGWGAKDLGGKGIGDDMPRFNEVGRGSWGRNLDLNLDDSGFLNHIRSDRGALRLCDFRAGSNSRLPGLWTGILRSCQTGRVVVSFERAVILPRDRWTRGRVVLKASGLRPLSPI